MSIDYAYRSKGEPGSRRLRLRKAVAGVLAVALIGGAVTGGYLLGETGPVQAKPLPQGNLSAGVTRPALAPTSFRDVTAKVMPAVVNISTTVELSNMQLMSGDQPVPGLPENSPFQEFFKHFFEGPMGPGGPGGKREGHALGSGFIISPDGYVVTNNHVVDKASEISVNLQDHRKFEAKLIGVDPKTDLALLKIKSDEPLPYVTFGDSDQSLPGDWVVAIGNPFGLGGSVTVGVVSARGRDLHSGPYDDFIQIDAPINKGNSGGPTFNLNGEVVGINTAIYSPNGGSVGIGFAIPANMAKPVIDQLRNNGSVKRGWIGVQIQMVTPEIADSLGMDKPKGALVVDVTPDSPAAKAGLKSGDVILRVGGDEITDMQVLPRLVANLQIGADVRFQILRDGSEKALALKIGKMPAERKVASLGDHEKTPSGELTLGMSLEELSPTVRQQVGIPDDVDGVLVTGVKGDSPAAEAGIAPGDIVVSIGSDTVKTPAQVSSGIEKAKKSDRSSVLARINRGGAQRFVALPLAT